MKRSLLALLYAVYRQIFARRIFYPLNFLLFNLGLRGMGVMNFESDRASGEAYFIRQYVKNLRDGVILDVGANEGRYARMLRAVNCDTKIYCVEPHPVTYRKLQQHAGELKLEVYNFAAGSQPGEMELHDYAANDGSSHASLHPEVFEHLYHANTVAHKVRVLTLDEFVRQQDISHIALLKIDTEGHEREVLKGLQKYIEAGKVDAIHFEFNEMNIASRAFFHDFWHMLPAYDFYRMLPAGLLPLRQYSPLTCEVFAYQNILCLRKQ